MSRTRFLSWFMLAMLATGVAAGCGDPQARQVSTANEAGSDPTTVIVDPTAPVQIPTATAAPPTETPPTTVPETAPTLAPVQPPQRTDAISLDGGGLITAGGAYRVGTFTFVVPDGFEFRVGYILRDPGGTGFVLVETRSGSVLRLEPGIWKETSRSVTDPAIDSVFTQIVNSIIVDH